MLDLIYKEVNVGNVKERQFGDLSLFKYSHQCLNEKAWNDVNIRCRGIIFNRKSGEIVCRPFNKFFGIDQNNSTTEESLQNLALKYDYWISEKFDGSLCATWFNEIENLWYCSTPGSIESEQAIYASEVMLQNYNLESLNKSYTYVCELITPWDNKDKVCNYDYEAIILHDVLENSWDIIRPFEFTELKSIAEKAGFIPPTIYGYSLDNMPRGDEIDSNHEGFVITFANNFKAKIKSNQHKRISRLISYCNYKNIIECLQEDTIDSLIENVTHPVCKLIVEKAKTIKKEYAKIDRIINITWQSIMFSGIFQNDFKKIALLMDRNNVEQYIKNAIYRKMRGKEYEHIVWKKVLENFIKDRIRE